MFHATFHLTSGDVIGAELDTAEVERFIRDLLALPDAVGRILDHSPSDDDLSEREGQLQLVAVALGEELRVGGTLNFLAEYARSVVIDTAAVAAVEVLDPDAPPSKAGRIRIASRQNVGVPVA